VETEYSDRYSDSIAGILVLPNRHFYFSHMNRACVGEIEVFIGRTGIFIRWKQNNEWWKWGSGLRGGIILPFRIIYTCKEEFRL